MRPQLGPRGVVAAVVFSALLAAAATVAVPATAIASWSAGSAPGATGRAAALTMPGGPTPTAGTTAPGGSSVLVIWAASIGDVPLDGYEISSFDAVTGAPRAVGAGCAGLVVGLTCTEDGVPPGTWRYAVTPRSLTWAGAPSALSDPVTVLPT